MILDNGPQLTAAPFAIFLLGLGIRHTLVAPFHPASNGQAERMVHSTKKALGKMGLGDWQAKIDKYFLVQHSTPCPLTNQSPPEVLRGRQLRTTLD